MPTAKWLSLGQAAAQSGGKVSVSTLRRYVAAGRVRGAIRTPGGVVQGPARCCGAARQRSGTVGPSRGPGGMSVETLAAGVDVKAVGLALPRLLLRIPEVAEVTGFSRAQIYIELREGRMRALHCGRAIRVPVSEVERWIATRLDDEHGNGPSAVPDEKSNAPECHHHSKASDERNSLCSRSRSIKSLPLGGKCGV